MTIAILFCCVAGFMQTIFWAIGFGLVSILFYLYFKTLRVCQGFMLERFTKKSAREKETLKINYRISNTTAFSFPSIYLEEAFDGVAEQRFGVEIKEVKPGSIREVIKKVILNNGMGIKEFKPIELIIKDDLGIFEFKLSFPLSQQIEVLPFIEDVPVLKSSVTPFSIEFGQYDIPRRGDSNLLIGTRPYVHGDPVKKINWKLSRKSQGLIVNEFEKNTNTFVTFLLDLDSSNQLGSGSLSTWEMAKDVALSLIVNEITRRNSVQIISNNLYIPFGNGADQLGIIEKHFTHHEMQTTQEERYLSQLYDIPPEGQIYYICPMVSTVKVLRTLDYLKSLSALNFSISVFILNPYRDLLKEMKGDFRLGLMEMQRQSLAEFEKIQKDLTEAGVSVVEFEVKKHQSIRDELQTKAMHILEVE
jgi:uncharacterized protein (DUF58 family)